MGRVGASVCATCCVRCMKCTVAVNYKNLTFRLLTTIVVRCKHLRFAFCSTEREQNVEWYNETVLNGLFFARS